MFPKFLCLSLTVVNKNHTWTHRRKKNLAPTAGTTINCIHKQCSCKCKKLSVQHKKHWHGHLQYVGWNQHVLYCLHLLLYVSVIAALVQEGSLLPVMVRNQGKWKWLPFIQKDEVQLHWTIFITSNKHNTNIDNGHGTAWKEVLNVVLGLYIVGWVPEALPISPFALPVTQSCLNSESN